MSIVQGDFPDTLKIAKVIPIYKGDDEQMVQNYRPISILPFFSKIYEKIIYNHIINFLTINCILYDKQFGFRKGHATNHAIITLVDKVTRALDTGKVVVGVYLDLRKALTRYLIPSFWISSIEWGFEEIYIVLRIEHNLLTIMAIPQKLNQSKLGSPRAQSWVPYFLSVSLMIFQNLLNYYFPYSSRTTQQCS